MTEPALALHGIVKRYPGVPPVTAVDGVDLAAAPGEVLGLLGPNGAGKSTLIGISTTRVRPTSGRVEVLGVDAHAAPARVKRHLGVVTQGNTLDRSLDLWENLYFHCRYFGWSRASARRRADELLERFRLTDRRRARPPAISGGMAQRLQVARALAHRPAVLFLDEPTAGLDPQSRLALWELVEDVRAEGVTVLLTTHYMEEADRLCDRVAIIDHGRVLVCDRPEVLKARYGAAAVVDLVLTGAAPVALLEGLRGLPAVTTVEGDGVRLRVLASSAEGLVSRLVATVGVHAELRDLSVSGSTLEAVFIGLTGRDLRE